MLNPGGMIVNDMYWTVSSQLTSGSRGPRPSNAVESQVLGLADHARNSLASSEMSGQGKRNHADFWPSARVSGVGHRGSRCVLRGSCDQWRSPAPPRGGATPCGPRPRRLPVAQMDVSGAFLSHLS